MSPEAACRRIAVAATTGIRGNDQGVQRESHRAIAMLGVLNERAASLGQVHFAHGRPTPGTGAGRAGGCARVRPGLVFGRVRVVSAAGSRYIPETFPSTAMVATFCSSKLMVMTRPFT